MKPKRTKFGELLRHYRKITPSENSSGPLPRHQLARAANMSEPAIEKYERGERRPSGSAVFQIARALSLKPTQSDALVNAAAFDILMEFMQDYMEAAQIYKQELYHQMGPQSSD